jgi:hypothetical protein
MKTAFSGGCACGAIRYESAAEPAAMVQCHCRDCQRATGGACIYVVVVPANAFKLTRGALRYHCTESVRMGHQRRGFCAECGSPLTAGENREGTTEFVGITVASLDDPSEFPPQMHAWTSDAQPWDHLNPVLPRFEKYPPS